MFTTLKKRLYIRKQLHKVSPEFIPVDDGFRKHWEDATTEEKMEVINTYNKFYCKDENFLNLTKANQAFTGSRWITIKYTWGVKPV